MHNETERYRDTTDGLNGFLENTVNTDTRRTQIRKKREYEDESNKDIQHF